MDTCTRLLSSQSFFRLFIIISSLLSGFFQTNSHLSAASISPREKAQATARETSRETNSLKKIIFGLGSFNTEEYTKAYKTLCSLLPVGQDELNEVTKNLRDTLTTILNSLEETTAPDPSLILLKQDSIALAAFLTAYPHASALLDLVDNPFAVIKQYSLPAEECVSDTDLYGSCELSEEYGREDLSDHARAVLHDLADKENRTDRSLFALRLCTAGETPGDPNPCGFTVDDETPRDILAERHAAKIEETQKALEEFLKESSKK